jgi:lysophospholipase L1-like esterase
MPATKMDSLPKGVQNRARSSSGGRISMISTASRLALRYEGARNLGPEDFEVYVDGRSQQTKIGNPGSDRKELVLFQDLDQREKEIVIYLPHVQEVVVTSIGVDESAVFRLPDPGFAHSLPVVFYGSSVCQGSGADHSGQTYEAIIGRELNLDFVNLGFGGAGKAEGNVVELVNTLPACCYVFDLGKSYGGQDASAFRAMIEAVRKKHPMVPVIVMTPITSKKEVDDPAYAERSIHTRKVMRDTTQALMAAGDTHLYLLEGEDLLGFREHFALSKDGVHPSDQGYAIIAGKLLTVMKEVLQK